LPFHPKTNGKIERYQETPKEESCQLPYEMPSEVQRAIYPFVEFHGHHRHHEAFSNVTPTDIYHGRRDGILSRREDGKLDVFRE